MITYSDHVDNSSTQALLFGPRSPRPKPPAPAPHGLDPGVLAAHPQLADMLASITKMHDQLTRLQQRHYQPRQDSTIHDLLDALTATYDLAGAAATQAAEACIELAALTGEDLRDQTQPGQRARELVREIGHAEQTRSEADFAHTRAQINFDLTARKLLRLEGEILFLDPDHDPGTNLPETDQSALNEMERLLDQEWPAQYQDRDDFTQLMLGGARALSEAVVAADSLRQLINEERKYQFQCECGSNPKLTKVEYNSTMQKPLHKPSLRHISASEAAVLRAQSMHQLGLVINDRYGKMCTLPDLAEHLYIVPDPDQTNLSPEQTRLLDLLEHLGDNPAQQSNDKRTATDSPTRS